MWYLGTWISGGLGIVGFTVGFNDVKGLFWPKFFCDSIHCVTDLPRRKLVYHRISSSLVHGYFTNLWDKCQSVFKFFCVGMFGVLFNVLHEQRLKEMDNANTDVLYFMWTDELHTVFTLPYPGQRCTSWRLRVLHVALSWQIPCKGQQTQPYRNRRTPWSRMQLGHLLSIRCAVVVLRDVAQGGTWQGELYGWT